MPQEQKRIEDISVYPLLLLEDYFPHTLRHKFFRRLFPIISILLLLFLLLSSANYFVPAEDNPFLPALRIIIPRVEGLFLLAFAFWLFIYLLETFHRAVFFHNRAYIVARRADKKASPADFPYEMSSEVAGVLYHTQNGDTMLSYLNSHAGPEIMLRCGLTLDDLEDFMRERTNIFTLDIYDIFDAKISGMEDLSIYLFKNYTEFSDFLFKRGIGEKDFIGAVKWAVRLQEEREFRERWWGRDTMKKIGSLGRDFSFGQTFMLDRYAGEITIGGAAPASRELQWEDEVFAVETALSKAKESNVMIIGDDGIGTMDVVYEFAYRIDIRAVPPGLQDQRVLLVDSNLIVATTKEKAILEEKIIKLLNEAIRAGNVILVFDHFTSFVQGARSLGTDVIDLLNPYLLSPKIHIIALAPTEEYHRLLAPNGEMVTRFELVQVKTPESPKIISVLEDGATMMERKHRVIFTYPAIVEVFHSAENYITAGVMPDKANDLLMELPSYMEEHDIILVKKENVLDYVRFKTKIPVGEIRGEEKAKLENLEKELHKRIVGQHEAIVAISDAMRRARAGVRDPKKPIGTFLFLGPTGVGKTETAKALAAVYFGGEDKMSRLDMSEYQGEDALERLIGSFELNKPGTLTMVVKNTPYGVLLLDEFEKTHKDVQNLFLQILDEGFFSDMGGHRINARNLIFIATSNAGANLMYESIKSGDPLSGLKQYIIDQIIKDGILKPELINRFDGVILFNPLEKKDIAEIARLMAVGLQKRVKEEQSINLTVNDALVQALVREGNDPLFGGRPMARAVKEKIEKLVAQKIIAGSARAGSTIELTEEELR